VLPWEGVKVRVVGTVVGVSLRPSVEIPENPLKFPSCAKTSSRVESFRPKFWVWAGAKRAVIGDAIVNIVICSFQNPNIEFVPASL